MNPMQMAVSGRTVCVPDSSSLSLPADYIQQPGNLTLDTQREGESYWSEWRISESHRWQHHVYEWAARVVRERGLTSVLDVGCGVCTKLTRHLQAACADVAGVDQASALEVARGIIQEAER